MSLLLDCKLLEGRNCVFLDFVSLPMFLIMLWTVGTQEISINWKTGPCFFVCFVFSAKQHVRSNQGSNLHPLH